MSAPREPRRLLEGGAGVDAHLAAALRKVSRDGPTHAQLEAIAEQLSLRTSPLLQTGLGPEGLATKGAAKVLGAKWLGLAALGGALWLGAYSAWPSPTAPPAASWQAVASRNAQALSASSASSGAAPPGPDVVSTTTASDALRRGAPVAEPPSRGAATSPQSAARAASALSAAGAAFEPGAQHEPAAVARQSGTASPHLALTEPTQERGATPRPPAARARRTPASSAAREAPVVAELDEVALIASAQQLVQARPRQALYQLGVHARRFPQGAFAEERDALRVFALARLGELLSAQREARGFLQRYPSSIHRQQIAALLSAAK